LAYVDSDRFDKNGFPTKMKGKIDASRTKRQQQVMLWDWTARMLKGDQNIVYDGTKIQFVSSLQMQPGRNQTVINQILQPYRTVCGLAEVNQPQFAFAGAAPSWADITKALACTQAASHWWQDNKIDRVLARNMEYLCCSGTAALHTYFDPAKKRVVTEGVSAYDLLFEENCRTYEESEWRAIRHVYTRDALMDSYPKFADYLKTLPATQQIDNRQMVPDDRLDVWDIYFNDGKHGVLCADKWLWTGTTPGNCMPLVPYRFLRVPDQLWGVSMLGPLLDLQRQYNRYSNMQLDIADAHSAPVWMASYASGTPKSMFNNEPNNVIYYNVAGGAPTRVPPPQVPQHLFEITNRKQSEMMDLSGAHSTTMGKRAVGVTSGKAMEELKGADLGQLSSTLKGINDAVADTCIVAMMYWKEYIPESQMIRYFDSSIGTVVHKELAGTDLLDCPQVFITKGTLFTIDAQERDEKLKEALQMGLAEPKEVREQLSFRIGAQDANKKMVALSHGQDLLAACRKGLEIEIFPTDDKEAIRQVFMEFMQSPEYYEKAMAAHTVLLQTGDPRAAESLDRHTGIMEYIRDVVVSIDTFGMPVEAYLQKSTENVFPRNDPKPQDQIQAVGGPNSPQTQQQMLGANADMRQRGAKVAQAGRAYEAMRGTAGMNGAVG